MAELVTLLLADVCVAVYISSVHGPRLDIRAQYAGQGTSFLAMMLHEGFISFAARRGFLVGVDGMRA